ncbi:hypothetical protein BAGQ_0644 [Bacillus velezensis]|nr:hypothetical protein BCBMB205_05800 [Bacillus velezensis]ARZ56906.1 hypothetical protein BAGQ_0644 [Bacillus velezensis]
MKPAQYFVNKRHSSNLRGCLNGSITTGVSRRENIETSKAAVRIKE